MTEFGTEQQTSHPVVDTKPRLSFKQILNMSFGFFGIQFGFALQNANVSRIFETLGAKVENIPLLWIAAPITGLIVQALFNISVVISIVPAKGIPLPFISYGGSSVVVSLIGVGILLNISKFARSESPVAVKAESHTYRRRRTA